MPPSWPHILGLANPGLDNVAVLERQLDVLPGWVIFQRSVAGSPNRYRGDDFRPYSDRGVGVICCLEWDPGQGGTVPTPEYLTLFARRCREYVEASQGCHVWVIGDEMNAAAKWPLAAVRTDTLQPEGGPFQVLEPRYRRDRYSVLLQADAAAVQEGHFPITPVHYVACFRLIREAIKNAPGHAQDLVLIGAVAPWNADAQEAANPSGDWIHYFRAILDGLEPGACEGIALHTATAGPDPDLILTEDRLPFPFGGRRAGFRGFLDFIEAIPERHQALPVFVTEASQLQPWRNANEGWVMGACEQVLAYNRTYAHSPIRCLGFYQWEANSPWAIKNHALLIEDLKGALTVLADQQKREELHSVVWEQVALPTHAVQADVLLATLRFTNTGEAALRCSGDAPTRLGYVFRALDARGQGGAEGGERRLPLPADVGAGETVTMQTALRTPAAAGTYQLHLGLVHAQFVWSAATLARAQVCTLTVMASAAEVHSALQAATIPTDPEEDATAEKETTDVRDDRKSSTEPDAPAAPAPPPAIPEPLPPPAPPLPAILDISPFVPRSAAREATRDVRTLDRIVFVETGLPRELPLDAYREHFQQWGFDDVPVHFLLDPLGPAYQVRAPDITPAPFSRNLASAVVVGLTESAHTPDEAEARLRRIVPAGIAILERLSDQGLPLALDIGVETLDGQPPFCGCGEQLLAVVGPLLEERWRQRENAKAPLTLHPVALPLEAAPAPPPAPEPKPESTARIDPDPPLPPLDASSVRPVDPEAPDAIEWGNAYRHKQGLVVWATGEDGTTPLDQVTRIHALRLEDILFHFVIDPVGNVFETRRSNKPDRHLAEPHRGALHIGLMGDFRQARPPLGQTQACSRLLACLAQGNGWEPWLTADAPAAGFVVGTDAWRDKSLWRADVARQAQERLTEPTARGTAAIASETAETASLASVARTASDGTEAAARGDAPAAPDFADGAAVSVLPPRLTYKVGNLPLHPRTAFPVRDLDLIRTICVHHSNAPASVGPEQLAQALILDQRASDAPLPGLPYHFFIHPDGQIDHCVDLTHTCRSVAPDAPPNERIVSVCLAGKFTQVLHPTSDQLKQAGLLIAWLMQKHYIGLNDVQGHKDIDGSERTCPGEGWDQGRNWKATLFHYVELHIGTPAPAP